MKKAMLFIGAVGFGLLFPVMPASAHHAFAAEFDAKKGIKVSGTITKLEWTNPHAWLYVDVKDESGKLTSWSFELGSPNGLMRQGWSRNSMKIGDEVIVDGSLAKDGSKGGNARSVTMAATGKKLGAASSEGTNP